MLKRHMTYFQTGKDTQIANLYLEISEIDPPRSCWNIRQKQTIFVALHRLTAERVLCRSIDMSARKGHIRRSVLQQHSVQDGPAPCRHWIEPLSHGKTTEEKIKSLSHAMLLTTHQLGFINRQSVTFLNQKLMFFRMKTG